MIIPIPFRSNAHELYAADHSDWNTIRSYEMTEVGDRTAGYKTFVKFCYNTTGIASLVFAEDSVLTVKPRNDFDNLYEDDVVEWFFGRTNGILFTLNLNYLLTTKSFICSFPTRMESLWDGCRGSTKENDVFFTQ
ncbi:MAG: hypothetical protein N3A54_05680 [Patescibacteria group bacterium]|nr:hypothetical protein [Patescibacteria group bacterium]